MDHERVSSSDQTQSNHQRNGESFERLLPGLRIARLQGFYYAFAVKPREKYPHWPTARISRIWNGHHFRHRTVHDDESDLSRSNSASTSSRFSGIRLIVSNERYATSSRSDPVEPSQSSPAYAYSLNPDTKPTTEYVKASRCSLINQTKSFLGSILERVTRLELATLCLGSRHSTTELHPHNQVGS